MVTMAIATSRSPDGWRQIQERFSEFGYLDFHCIIPTSPIRSDDAVAQNLKWVNVLSEWTLRIMLQPKYPIGYGPQNADSEIREAMYEMAEDAIAVARENYVLLNGPEILIRGGEGKNYLEGTLTLEFRMRREGET